MYVDAFQVISLWDIVVHKVSKWAMDSLFNFVHTCTTYIQLKLVNMKDIQYMYMIQSRTLLKDQNASFIIFYLYCCSE